MGYQNTTFCTSLTFSVAQKNILKTTLCSVNHVNCVNRVYSVNHVNSVNSEKSVSIL